MNMKRISFYTLSLAFISLGLVSCGKTTKGKVTNEWKVTSYNEKIELVNASGDVGRSTTSSDGTTVSNEYFSDPAIGPSTTQFQTGTANVFELTIKKDGTWSLIKDFTYKTSNTSDQTKQEKSGTWSFVEKTKGDDFKKNERILFNVLSENETVIQISNQVVVNNQTSSNTYLTGENVLIYTITESKKDQLGMTLEESYSGTQGSSATSKTTSEQFILEAK
jgi:hypothetical protein